MQFTNHQGNALQRMRNWWEGRRVGGLGGSRLVFNLQGLAGTGKTTIIQEFTKNVKGTILYGAYTAKAASVMRAKGLPTASTIHSMIYRGGEDMLKYLLQSNSEALLLEKDPKKIEALHEERKKILRKSPTELKFQKIPKLPDGVSLIVLDECSMIDETMCDDLESFNIPILVVGDPGQLPPINGYAGFFQRGADTTMTEIVRQAADSPIIQMAMMAREDGKVPEGVYGDCTVHDVNKLSASRRDALLMDADKLIVRTNKTRVTRNEQVRRLNGKPTDKPVVGDVIMCWQNHQVLSIWNGCEYEVHAVEELPNGYFSLELSLYGDPTASKFTVPSVHPYRFQGYSVDVTGWGTEKHKKLSNPLIGTADLDTPAYNRIFEALQDRRMVQFDFCHAITCHKAQGSQWDNVYVMPEFNPKYKGDDQKWLYTAITRAAKEVHIRL